MTYCCSSGTNVMRGSSMPQISSGNSFGLGIKVGLLSISHPSTPFTERAAHKCDNPRRSSTRQSNNVEPSASRVAPGLNTLLIEYGQSLLVRIGLEGWRTSNGSKLVPRLLTGSCAMVKTEAPLVPILAGRAFPAVPSGMIASIPRPGSHWRGRDEGRHGTHQ